MKSLLLDKSWDLSLDKNGNLAIADGGYALAQDAACAIRLLQSEAWYDIAIGVPYFQAALGQYPALAFMKAQFVHAALRVPGVKVAQVYLAGVGKDRKLTGQVHVWDASGGGPFVGNF